MTRKEAITILEGLGVPIHAEPAFDMAIEALKAQENMVPLDGEDIMFVTPEEYKAQEWIPVGERLPKDIRPVIVTWKNNDPASYYQYIVGKHFIGTAHYHRGKWYWYSSVTEDLLAEYGKCDSEEFDEAIEAVAWMPLPKPWKGADDE